MGIFTAWICTQSFAVKLLNTGGMNLGSWLIGLVYICFPSRTRSQPRWSEPVLLIQGGLGTPSWTPWILSR